MLFEILYFLIFILLLFIIYFSVFEKKMNFLWLINDNYTNAFLKIFILIIICLFFFNRFLTYYNNYLKDLIFYNYCENFKIINCPKCITKPCNCKIYMKCGTNKHLQRKCVWKQADM